MTRWVYCDKKNGEYVFKYGQKELLRIQADSSENSPKNLAHLIFSNNLGEVSFEIARRVKNSNLKFVLEMIEEYRMLENRAGLPLQ